MDDERAATLRELKGILDGLQAGSLRTLVPRLEQVRQKLGALGLSIDLDASETLGSPLVMLTMPPKPAPCFDSLTPRETEVASLLAVGLRNRDIALALELSVSTVKDHVHAILRKTGLDGRAAVAAAWRGG